VTGSPAERLSPSAEENLAYWTDLEGMTRIERVRQLTPGAIADNAGRIYDWMREVGLAPDSATREALFAFAAEKFGVDYDVFYDAWLEERPADLKEGS
jgi:hypothetical protein